MDACGLSRGCMQQASPDAFAASRAVASALTPQLLCTTQPTLCRLSVMLARWCCCMARMCTTAMQTPALTAGTHGQCMLWRARLDTNGHMTTGRSVLPIAHGCRCMMTRRSVRQVTVAVAPGAAANHRVVLPPLLLLLPLATEWVRAGRHVLLLQCSCGLVGGL